MAIAQNRTARVRGIFTDPLSGAFVDPTAGQLTLVSPRGETLVTRLSDGLVQRASAGTYYYDLLAGAVGTWKFTWESLAKGQEARFDGTFTVTAA